MLVFVIKQAAVNVSLGSSELDFHIFRLELLVLLVDLIILIMTVLLKCV